MVNRKPFSRFPFLTDELADEHPPRPIRSGLWLRHMRRAGGGNAEREPKGLLHVAVDLISQGAAMMPEKSAYETGARKYPARTGPDPSDAFSQDAAGNKPPASGVGPAGDPGKGRRKPDRKPDRKDASPEPDHSDPPPRDTREAPAPNPNGKPVRKDA